MAFAVRAPTPTTISPEPAPQPLYMFDEGTIVAARPLHELLEHCRRCELPSWALIGRAINALFQGIITGNYCDKVALLRAEGLYHSLNGKTTDQSLDRFGVCDGGQNDLSATQFV